MDQSADPQLEHVKNKKLILVVLGLLVVIVGIIAFVGGKDYRVRKAVEKRALEKNPDPSLIDSVQKGIERRTYEENPNPEADEQTQEEIKNRSLE